MSKITWDAVGERYYETGVKNGVLYLPTSGVYSKGVAWNGLTSVTESPSGAEATALYADDIKYLSLYSTEEFGATIEAYTYPEEFAECDGSAEIVPGVYIGQQNRKPFGLAYRTKLGNAATGQDFAYKIHLIYGAQAAPTQKDYNTINESPETATLSWELTTTPVEVEGFKPTASLVVESHKASSRGLAALEAILYGSETEEARLPLPDEVGDELGEAGRDHGPGQAQEDSHILLHHPLPDLERCSQLASLKAHFAHVLHQLGHAPRPHGYGRPGIPTAADIIMALTVIHFIPQFFALTLGRDMF